MEGQLWSMWMFSTPQVPVYAIQPWHGFEQAARILGADFARFLVRDGRAVYRRFVHALHQSCLAHLLRGCRGNDSAGGSRKQSFRVRYKPCCSKLCNSAIVVSKNRSATRA